MLDQPDTPETMERSDLPADSTTTIMPTRGGFWSRLPPIEPRPATVLAVAVSIALVGAAVVGLPRLLQTNRASGNPTVASAAACANPAECAVEIRFSAPVDRGLVADSLSVQPSSTIVVAWRDDRTMLLRPSPLQPSVNYRVRLTPVGLLLSNGATQPAPVTIAFVATGTGRPVTLVTPVALATAQSTAAPAVAPTTIPPSATTVPSPLVASTPKGASSPIAPAATPSPIASVSVVPSPAAACPVAPVRRFGLLYQSDSAVSGRLGCARVAEAATTAVVQDFANGLLLRQAGRAETMVLSGDGRWAHYSDATTDAATPNPSDPLSALGKFLRDQSAVRTALGGPKGAERTVGAATQPFDHGSLLWTADRVIYAIYDDGTWEQHADTFVDPIEVAATASAAVGGNSAAQTTAAPATPVPAATPAAITAGGCQTQPIRGFGLVYSQNAALSARLGCALGPEAGTKINRQAFDNGTMLQPAGSADITVLRKDGTYTSAPNGWQDGMILPDVGAAPTGHVVPAQGFGALWRQFGGPQSPLGWATGPAATIDGAIETFANGRMFWTADRMIYALFDNGTYQPFADNFVESPAPSSGSAG
jgi:hypothetical protein